MENTIKLRPLQLEQLSKIRAQRTQLTKTLQEADQREKDLLALFFEEAGIKGNIGGVALNGDTLSFTVQVPEAKPVKKLKEKKIKEVV
jgi:hypothetical protein